MTFPVGVRTRLVVCKAPLPPIDLESNAVLTTRVKVSTSRALIWNSQPITQVTSVPVRNTDSGQVSFTAMVSDMAGMIDAKTMQLIDVSDNKQTHLLTAKIKYYHLARLVWVIDRTFPVPTGDDPLDLDELINPLPEEGILVPVPSISDQQVADAVVEYLTQNELATPEYVNDAMISHINAEFPHPVYDDIPDLRLIFNNGLI